MVMQWFDPRPPPAPTTPVVTTREPQPAAAQVSFKVPAAAASRNLDDGVTLELKRMKSAAIIQARQRGRASRKRTKALARRALEGSWLRAFRYLKVGVPVENTTDTRETVSLPPPIDATCLERSRDHVLEWFCNPTVAKIFIVLALCVICILSFWGAVIAWSFLGLFLGVDNGWGAMSQLCLELAASYNTTLQPKDIPRPPDATWDWSDPPFDHCNDNQRLFNLSVKAFTACFSYINVRECSKS